jgi:serine/threonine protein kinase
MYMSPEAVNNHHYTLEQQNGKDPAPPQNLPGLPNDWWMLGILCYELLLGAVPFGGESLEMLQTGILTHDLSFTPTLRAEDDEHREQESPSRPFPPTSPSEAVAIAPPEISTAARDFLGRLLDKSPSTRLGTDSTEDVRGHSWFGSAQSTSEAGGWDWTALERKEIPPVYVPASSDELLSNFPDRSESFANDSDLAFHAPARSAGQSPSDPFASAKKGAVNDFYFDRQAARAKAAEREAMEALFQQRAAAAGVATLGGTGGKA